MQRACEKSFDAGLASLYVPRLLGPSKQQLLDAFGKQLTTAATALQVRIRARVRVRVTPLPSRSHAAYPSP